jgi:hypothetical protein
LPGAWLGHQIAEIEWGAAEINATFGNHGGVLTPLDHHPRYSRRPQIAQSLCRYSSAPSNPRQSRLYGIGGSSALGDDGTDAIVKSSTNLQNSLSLNSRMLAYAATMRNARTRA